MIWFVLFLLCAVICIAALAVWLGAAVIQGLLESIERSLANFTHGRVITGALYVVPAALFAYVIVQLGSLAISFYTAVLRS